MRLLDEEITKIEDELLYDTVYAHSSVISNFYTLRKNINSIISKVEGPCHFLHYDDDFGGFFFYMLNDDNRSKFIRGYSKRKEKFEKKELIYELFRPGKKFRTLILLDKYSDIVRDLRAKVKWKSKKDLLAYIVGITNRSRIVNLPGELRKHGYLYHERWYHNVYVTYESIHQAEQGYYDIERMHDKGSVYAALDVFGQYYFIRDFYHAKKWMDIIIAFADSDLCQKLRYIWDKTEVVLDRAKEEIKGKNHIVMNWIDGLRYDEVGKMAFVSCASRRGLFFSNMYSQTSYTHGTLNSLLTGLQLIDDDLRNKKYYDYIETCKLKQILEKYDYEIEQSCAPGVYGESRDLYTVFLSYIYGSALRIPSPLLLFRGVCVLQNNDRKFIIVHECPEIHEPRYCPDFPRDSDAVDDFGFDESRISHIKEQIDASIGYVDGQIEYYSAFYPENGITIYMSDHGQARWEKIFNLKAYHHVLFSIADNKTTYNVDDFFDYTQFADILDKILDDRASELSDVSRGYALCQNGGPYGKWKKKVESIMKNNETRLIGRYLAYRGIVTEQDQYILMSDGNEIFYHNDQFIDSSEYQSYNDIITVMKKNAGDNFQTLSE